MNYFLIKKLVIFGIVLILIPGCSASVRFASKPIIKKEYPHQNLILKENETELVREAERWLGTPYCWGGESINCTDCSGFVSNVFSAFGISLPRTAAEQYDFSKKVSDGDKKVGDLVFFGLKNRITHVGIYAGNNQIIHASSSKGVIRQSLDDSYLSKNFACFGRVAN
ncbi:MAG: nlpC/P60 family protein [Ignavibacteria bacterium]|nr:nlpC/P60 family protein [Ignavibacteria bacterium]